MLSPLHSRPVRCYGQTSTDSLWQETAINVLHEKLDVLPPRARGDVALSVKTYEGRSVLDEFRQAGSLKALFPRVTGHALQTVLVNTAGGITGGDRFSISAKVPSKSHLVMTTQAAERAYRAQTGETGRVRTRINIANGARLDWLPQETILFDGAALDRQLHVELTGDARLLLCEPLIFGRAAMGETVRSGALHDRVTVTRDGIPLFADAMHFTGDIAAHLARPTIANGAGSLASVLYVHPDAESHLDDIRATLGPTAGASLLHPDVLFIRALASDSFELRKVLCPILTRLSGAPLPRPWMI